MSLVCYKCGEQAGHRHKLECPRYSDTTPWVSFADSKVPDR